MIIALLQFVQSIQIYITNAEHVFSNATCEIDNVTLYPCERLEDLSLKLDSLGTLHITLLPGDYCIRDSFSLRFDSISNVYFNSWNNLGQVRIVCDGGDFSLHYTNVNIVSITNVEFYHCSTVAPTISTLAVSKVTIKYVNCTNSSIGCVKTKGMASSLNISHCIFKGSTKDVGVNVTSLSKIVYITDTVFESNQFGSLKPCPVNYIGNVIIVLERCVFAHNKARNKSRGAAIIVEGSFKNVRVEFNGIKISHCQLLNNSADEGGAMVITDFQKIHIDNSEFTNNIAYDSGGAITLKGTRIQKRREFIIRNCTFINNYAQNGGVIYIELVTQIQTLHSIANSNFSNNKATENGGAVLTVTVTFLRLHTSFLDYHSVYINNVNFDNNLAENGGALFLTKVYNITFIDCSLSNNVGHHTSNISKGGAVAIIQEVSSVINIIKTIFSKNIADIGGALWMSSPYSSVVYIINSSFYGNSAVKFGGSLYATGFIVQISHANFFENKAKIGGAQHITNTQMNISSGIYVNNTACAGGAIYSNQSYIHIGMVHLIANKAFSTNINSLIKITTLLYDNCHHSESSRKGGAIFV